MANNRAGDYTLEQPLGSGAVGTAYRGRHAETGQIVAVKLLNVKAAGEPDIQKRFVREVSVLEKLDHPNIVRHLDCGIDEDGRLYFVMELVDSGTLKDVLAKRGKLPWREAAECAAQICDALAHAHERGVIHRDLKPANLFLNSDGNVKVGDFGLARDKNMHRLTASGNTVGTCRYMAPEQVRGEDHLDGSVDLYALGCMLFEMIAGHVPYDGQSVVEVFEHHLFSPIPSLAAVHVECPTELVDLVEQLMSKPAHARPAAAAEVAKALRGIIRGEAVPLPEARGVHESDVQATAPANLVERMLQPGPSQATTPNWKAVGILAAIVAAAAAVWFALKG